MQAQDIMTRPVVTVGPDAMVKDIAALMLEKHISAVPVIDDAGHVVGMVSEGDLSRRAEIGTEHRQSWWLRLFTDDSRPTDYIKGHGKHARDVMTTKVVAVTPETDLPEIAATLERHNIKRVPVVQDGKPIGIISRANLLQAVAQAPLLPSVSISDRDLRSAILDALSEAGVETHLLRISVEEGSVDIFGAVGSKDQKEAFEVVLENVPGIVRSETNVGVVPGMVTGL